MPARQRAAREPPRPQPRSQSPQLPSCSQAAQTYCGNEKITGYSAVLFETVFSFRSEEHTSELQSQSNLVCRLLLEKKKKTQRIEMHVITPLSLGNEQMAG